MLSKECATEKFRLKNIFRVFKYRLKFAVENPDYFNPDGLLCFCGAQGSGKTLSAVNYVYKLMEMYPNCILVSNVNLSDYPIVTFEDFKSKNKKIVDSFYANCSIWTNPDAEEEEKQNDEIFVRNLVDDLMYSLYMEQNRVFPFNDNDDLSRYNNGDKGVIFFIDEIQLYMNSLKSKNINMDTMTQLSQQRKQRKHIVATSQVFGRMAKPLREQFSNVVSCRCILGCVQYNQLIDRDDMDESTDDSHLSGTVKQKFIWTHNPKMYKKYDTYYVIEKGKFASNEERKNDIYDTRHGLSDSN